MQLFLDGPLNDGQIKHSTSKSDLKRKLSDKALEEGSERHVELRIEGIELEARGTQDGERRP
jgi:transposase